VEKPVFSVTGDELRKIELDDSVFGLPVNDDVIYYAINNELANKRVGTACTKDRSEVHGSNAKPYKQKGTGRARRGDKKSPLLRGGGVIFGPKPRDFSYTIPKKMKRLAMKSILSLKVQDDRLTVIEDFTVESGKTRDLAIILNRFARDERAVIVFDEARKPEDADYEALKQKAALLKRAGGNIPFLSFLSYKRLRAHDLFYGRRVIIQESAVKKLSEVYGRQSDDA
jgi:large subunit ribosomal protein L4